MAQPVIQTSFAAGEWAPSLYARVDLAKYHSGAALLRNFFVDYRGGATARPGTKYVIQTQFNLTTRLIPFKAAFTINYLLEFGDHYIRFINNGAPVLETATTISGITKANPAVVTDTGHGYSNNDRIFISGIVGMTQVNGNYYVVQGVTANTYQLTDLNGVNVNSTGYSTYTSGGTAQRIYTLATPFLYSELSQIKYAQNVNVMVLCHPNHPPQQLTLISATNWTIGAIVFGSTVSAPTGLTSSTTLAAGNVNYSYEITAVDINGQESSPSAPIFISSLQDLRSVLGTIFLGWTAVTGATSYNIYKAGVSYTSPVGAGAQYGFVGNVSQNNFADSNITPDFSQGPPIAQSPFSGSSVKTITLTAGGNYTSVPVVSLTAPPVGGTTATAFCFMSVVAFTIQSGGGSYGVNDYITLPYGVQFIVTSIGGAGTVTGVSLVSAGLITSGVPPLNNVGGTTNGSGSGATFNLGWGVSSLQLSGPGSGYLIAPLVTFSGTGSGGAAGTTTLGASSAGNPTVPVYFQQRLILAGPTGNPQQFNASQPGSYYNFNTTNPVQADNAISGTLVSGQLNTIQNMIPQPQGLIMLADKQAWLLNGGSPGSPISAEAINANSQAYNGSATLSAIVANDHVLYVQAKGSIVRDLVFNFYSQVYTGADISVLSSHLFYGFNILEWTWAEEPFKLVWAVRNDGTMLTLTFLKDQELVAWAHSDTQGVFGSVTSVTETVASGTVDAVYTVVQRVVNGFSVQYIERFAELNYPSGAADAWCVDAGLSYSGGVPASTFSGAVHLAGATVTGLADGVVIPSFTMPVSGTFTLAAPATKVVVGLAYTPQLQTLPLDLGEPTVQGKRKKIAGVTLKVKDTLGLSMGRSAATALPLQDLIVGNVGSMTNQQVTGLVAGDVRGYIDPLWDVPGQYFIQQPLPYPASVLGVVPEIEIGDTQK